MDESRDKRGTEKSAKRSWEMGKGKEQHKSNFLFENTIMKLNTVRVIKKVKNSHP